jgi:hypothetical protein
MNSAFKLIWHRVAQLEGSAAATHTDGGDRPTLPRPAETGLLNGQVGEFSQRKKGKGKGKEGSR